VSEREAAARRWAALVCGIFSAVGLWFGAYRPLFYSGALLAILAALLITPAIALWLMRLLRPMLQRLRPVEGALAADSLIQSPRRTSSTVAALMLSLTLVIGLASGALAINRGITGWLTAALTADLVVTASQNLAARTFHFPAAIGEQMKTIQGVAIVDPVNTPRIVFHGQPHFVVAEDLELMHRVAPRKVTGGDEQEMYRLAAAGQGVLASDSLSQLANLRLGDVVELPTPMGLLRLPIVGLVEDYSDPTGTLLFDRRLYTKYWQDDSANQFNVFIRPGADPAQVRQRILERLGNQTRLFIFTNKEIRDYCFRAIDQGFAIMYAQIVVAVLVAILGIVNTLTVSITDRRRELGVLQAVGALRNQVRHTIWMEALCVGLVGLLMGLALGAVYAYFMRNAFHNDVSGVLLPFVYPVQLALSLFPLILGAAFLAALGPAESAVRGSLVEALEYE
jgi:putative ABC transport system permease protein